MSKDHILNTFEEFRKEAYLRYDTSKYDFKRTVSRIFSFDNLHELHTTADEWNKEGAVTFDNDQATPFHKAYYNSPLLPEMLSLYHQFVKEFIAPMFANIDNKLIFQRKPTFRVHLPNNVAVGQMHRDFDYRHPPGEINFWLPVTKVWGTNGIILESEPEKGDFHNITMDYGQIFRFWGNKCRHYNEKNTTGSTRVSIDFRVIPWSQFDHEAAEAGTSVKSGMKFVIGDYYDVCDIPGGKSLTTY